MRVGWECIVGGIVGGGNGEGGRKRKKEEVAAIDVAQVPWPESMMNGEKRMVSKASRTYVLRSYLVISV